MMNCVNIVGSMLVVFFLNLDIKCEAFFLRHKNCNELIDDFKKSLDVDRSVAFFLHYFFLQDAVVFIILHYFFDNFLIIDTTSLLVLCIIASCLITLANASAELS